MSELKTITYRGGVVTFSIPASWREEYAPEGGGTFYDDAPDSGTLRLNVLTMKSPVELTERSPVEVLSGRGADHDVRRLANGNATSHYVVSATESGQALQLHYWEVASPLPPRHMRLGIFSYTILASRASDLSVQAEIQLLGTSIAQAEFAKVMGGSGRSPAKPWWRFW